jgi:hypothetical protein
MRRLLVAAIALGFVTTAPVWRAAAVHAQASAPAAALAEIRDATDLQTRFNQDRGKTRLVLLVSPT